MHTQAIDYTADGLHMRGHLALDEAGRGSRPGVLVFPEAFGLSSHAMGRAERLAGMGYVALAADLYGGRYLAKGMEEAVGLLAPLRADPTRIRARAQGALDALLTRPEVDPGRIGAIGFCFGGTMALELGRAGAPVHAIAGFHSALATKTPEDAARIRGRVLVCIGADDPSIDAAQRAAFEAEMRAGGVNWQMSVYGGVVHSFTNADVNKLERRVSLTTRRPTPDPGPRCAPCSTRRSTRRLRKRSSYHIDERKVHMISHLTMRALLLGSAMCLAMPAAHAADKPDKAAPAEKAETPHDGPFKPDAKITDGMVNVGGRPIAYSAVAGTLVVHAKGWDDVPKPEREDGKGDEAKEDDDRGPSAVASMFYVAYLAKGAAPEGRPVTFLFNGGPGSSTVWLHMGAFGPRRVVTADDSHTPAAPYSIVNNDQSLLDASDLVFVDAPGAGFSRIAGKDKEKEFYGIDADAHAFAEFITKFLSKYGRWNSPKYIFGESYGTTRSAVLSNLLQSEYDVDLNGVILLSQIFSFDTSVDGPETNPGIDVAYPLALPTYAATAWYHHKLPNQAANLPAFLGEVEHFAMNDYTLALAAGSALPADRRDAIAAKLHEYTGLPLAYIKKANLRVSGGEFEKNLQDDTDTTTGRLDTRFSGPTMDPLSKEADYDPQSAAISSAYVSGFNDYARRVLKYGEGVSYKPEIDVFRWWNMQHQPPGSEEKLPQSANVMPDIAAALKMNPNLKIQLNGGYYDLATPFYEGIYEMQHLQIPPKLQGNIEFKQYESGHMVYAHQASLQQLHDNVAGFIGRTHGK